GKTIGFWDRRYNPKQAVTEYKQAVGSTELANLRFSEQLKALVGNKKDREALTFYLQGDESIKLTREQEQAANVVRDWFRDRGEEAQKAGVIEELRNDYVTQLWTGLNKNSSLLRNLIQSLGKQNTFSSGMSPKSRFNLERVIPSYKEGMAKGLIPSTQDIAEMVKI